MAFTGKIDAIKHVREKCFVKYTIPSPTNGTESIVYYERIGLKDAKDLVEDIMNMDANTEYTKNLIAQLRKDLATESERYHNLNDGIQRLLNSSFTPIKF